MEKTVLSGREKERVIPVKYTQKLTYNKGPPSRDSGFVSDLCEVGKRNFSYFQGILTFLSHLRQGEKYSHHELGSQRNWLSILYLQLEEKTLLLEKYCESDSPRTKTHSNTAI
jgi:hypothetical protein